MREARATEKVKKPGIIDTLSAGFDIVNRRPWILALPVLLDLLLWRGPQISAQPFLQGTLNNYQAALASGDQLVAPSGQNIQSLTQMADAAVAGFNMLTLLVLNIASVPSTMGSRPIDTTAIITVNNGVSFFLLLIILEIVGVLLSSVYYGAIAQQVRDGRVDFSRLFASLNWYVIHMFTLLLILIGVSLAFGVVLSLVVGAGALLGGLFLQAAVGVAGTVAYLLVVWALLFLFFAVDAIVVSEVDARRAILNSALVVGKNFWPALALIFLVFLITSGMQIIWSTLGDSQLGVVAGILGNAYVASGLAAASMLFYQSRLAGLEK